MSQESKSSKRTITDYYLEERDYLMRRGQAFAREFPRLMQFFREYQRYADPHVDRILEGVAFLTARLHRAFDENKGHLAMQFLRAFWPQFLRPIPSATLVEIKPRPTMSVPLEIPPNYELESRNLVRMEKGSRTVFQVKYSTSEALVVNPLIVEFVKVTKTGAGSLLHLGFRTVRGVSLSDLDLSRPLRLQLMAPQTNDLFNLYEDLRYNCSAGLSSVEIRCPIGGQSLPAPATITFPDPLQLPPLYPHQAMVFPGFRALHEFFILPERFLVFDVVGLTPLHEHKDHDGFELVIRFNKEQKNLHDWSAGNVRLHCVPVVNIFSGPCKVQVYTGETRRVPLLAGDFLNADGCSIYNLGEVLLRHFRDGRRDLLKECDFSRYGWVADMAAVPSYTLDFEFTRTLDDSPRPAAGSESGGDGTLKRNVYLILRDVPPPLSFAEAYTLTVDALWCNHDINSSLNQIQVSQGAPEPVMCENLFAPTRYIAPREPSVVQWRIVDLMALNYLSIQSIDAFRRMLEIFIADTSTENRIFIESLKELQVEKTQFWENRLPINGLRFTFSVSDEVFLGRRGQLLAFFDLIHSFLSHYVSINSKVEVCVILLDSNNKRLTYWPPLKGSRVAL